MLLPFAAGDLDELHALFTHPDVRRWLLDDEIVSPEWVAAEIAASGERFAAGGLGLWTVRERAGDALVGFVGFRPFFDPPELQLLFGLHPSRWGRGYATEAAEAAIAHAFAATGIEEIRAATDVPNDASAALLRRLGMLEWRKTAEGRAGTICFRLGRGEWAARPARPLAG